MHSLPILIVNAHSRCNCRCVMCDIWKTDTTRELASQDFARQLDSVSHLNLQWIVFSGGEPLMHSDLFGLCRMARARGIRLTILSTGLLLERFAQQVATEVDDVIVSLDGPAAVHDQIRRVSRAFDRLAKGIAAVRRHRPDVQIAGRCTVQKLNHASLVDTIAAAKAIGVDSISFLAADLTSEAFNRPSPWPILKTAQVALTAAETDVLEQQIDRISEDPLVADPPSRLRRIVDHFRCHLGMLEPTAPLCTAPWVSAVLEPDGAVRPCFFHRAIGNASDVPLGDVLNSQAARDFRSSLDVKTNPICRTCVCSLNRRIEIKHLQAAGEPEPANALPAY